MESLTFITGNQNKADRMKKYLNREISHKSVDLPEIQSLNLHGVVDAKVREAFKHVGTPVIVEDVSLQFTAMGELPGPLIKWFLKELKNEGLCRLLDGYASRAAVARVCFGYYDGNEVRFFDHEVPGTIAPMPRGESLFGWDPTFVPDGWEKTWAEMTDEETAKISMRRPALKKLEAFLNAR